MSAERPSAAPGARGATETVTAMYFVSAEAHPGMAPRLVEPFSKMGVMPARIHVSSEDGDGSELSADLRVNDVTSETAHLIDKALRRIIGVRQVITLTE